MLSRVGAVVVFVGLTLLFTTSPGSTETIRIDIAKLAYTPAEITAHVGDTVLWVSGDFVVHSATATNKAWDVTIPLKGSASVVLKSAGIAYFCRFHPNMKGRITVTDTTSP